MGKQTMMDMGGAVPTQAMPPQSVEDRINGYLASTDPYYGDPEPEPAGGKGAPGRQPAPVSDEGALSFWERDEDDEDYSDGEIAAPEAEAREQEADAPERPKKKSLSALAKHLGVSVEDIYQHLTVPVTTTEGRQEVTLGAWKDAYQEATLLRAQREAHRAEVAQAQSQLAQQQQEANIQLQYTYGVLSQVEQALVEEANGPEMVQLQQTNPQLYAVRYNALQMRYSQLQQAKQQTEQQVKQQMAKQQEAIKAAKAQQTVQVLSLIPEWRDSGVQEIERRAITGHLTKQGFTEQEVSGVFDARAWSILRKAWLYDQGVRNAPRHPGSGAKGNATRKPMEPGRPERRANAARQKAALREQFKARGDVRSLAALLDSDEYLGGG